MPTGDSMNIEDDKLTAYDIRVLDTTYQNDVMNEMSKDEIIELWGAEQIGQSAFALRLAKTFG